MAAIGACGVWRRPWLVGLLALGGGLVALTAGRPADLFGRVPSPSGTVRAEPRAVAVVDGATLRLHDLVIRLQGVRAPGRGAVCGALDGAVFDCGAAAAAALGQMLAGRGVSCRLQGWDHHGLPQGRCEAGGTAVNQALVAAGWARADDADLAASEAAARAALRGIWRTTNASTF